MHGVLFKQLFSGLIFIFIAFFLQQSSLLDISYITPNILLVVSISLVFFIREKTLYYFLAFFVSFFIYISTGSLSVSGFFFALIVTAFFIHTHLPASSFISFIFLVGIATPVLYLFIDPSFSLSNPVTILGEMLYNIGIGMIVFFMVQSIFYYEEKITIAI